MNKIKKVALGILMAGLAFGFSAFTTVKKRSVLIYYKVNMSYPNANDPRGYEYYSGDMCAPGGNTCSAQWDIGTHLPPTDGDALPISGVTFQTGSVYSGHADL
ncbi:hypothetical protein [Pedobacter frigoris]|uniref:Uncharacterized protein n=1 Tax=Pedobacter frigoris TaxID=2571272 RepID=A0A4U1CIC2_9SPHI|nr:hypothetical protein [Pedobacter frigoris]TKC06201.1 hypothetical protein FA047_12835 [Pedobacter frigoris]